MMNHVFYSQRMLRKDFIPFWQRLKKRKVRLIGLKGQTTGPITFCTGLVDQAGRAIFYNDQLRDVAVKHLAMKARWQTKKMAEVGWAAYNVF